MHAASDMTALHVQSEGRKASDWCMQPTLVHRDRCWKQFLTSSGASPTARYSST